MSTSTSSASCVDASPPVATLARPCVYFDGGCPLCRAEISAYQHAVGGDALHWVDANGCSPDDLGNDLARPAALARMHVRRADGTLLQGAAAFAEIWAALPRWRWLSRLARLPGALPLLDLGYTIFLKIRPIWRRAPQVADVMPRPLLQELRTDHAGETGAVMIYRGILAVTRDPALRSFAQHHLETEQRHLSLVEQVTPVHWRSRLLPLWRLSGWMTGALPACFGPRAVYATIQTVETFVDRHYAEQLVLIDTLQHQVSDQAAKQQTGKRITLPRPPSDLQALREMLSECQADEVAHREDAAARWDGRGGVVLALWCLLVGKGAHAAVRICRHV